MDLNNFYSKKYLKYKKKYLDLKGNGPDLQKDDILISYDSRNGYFNKVTILGVTTLDSNNKSKSYVTKTNNDKRVRLLSDDENITWIRENDSKGFYRNQNPSVQQAWDKHGLNPKNRQQSSSTTNPQSMLNQSMSNMAISTNRTNDINVSINLPVIMNQGILDRVKICLNNGGTIEHAHHITLYAGKTDNYDDLEKITTNSSSTIEIFFNICNDPRNSDTGRGQYKILGQHLSDEVKNIIDSIEGCDYLEKNHGTENNKGKGVFLAKVFFANSINFTRVYDKIKEGTSTLADKVLYTRDNYVDFTLHLSLAKFNNVRDAVVALRKIYEERFTSGFDNYFNNPSNFANHLNISIN